VLEQFWAYFWITWSKMWINFQLSWKNYWSNYFLLFVHAPMRNELKYLTLKLKSASLLLIILTNLSGVCACPNEEWAGILDTQAEKSSKYIHAKNTLKTVLACSEAEINGFLCFEGHSLMVGGLVIERMKKIRIFESNDALQWGMSWNTWHSNRKTW
jgi:hypothetical protein